ncbi:hypothetical protein KUCAC02_008356 [Chaenocephalus aceratus]|uniref:Uncharacterized protein n=1 Tax=Chaenocephalus aceratus TaxID=36190 RepID=A0ACB9X891_CHAAC|nr:hypothetical protein KUCAC02_008356 [Chaenocephalus aceratus]
MAAPDGVVGVEGAAVKQHLSCQIRPPGMKKRPQFGTRFLTDPRQVLPAQRMVGHSLQKPSRRKMFGLHLYQRQSRLQSAGLPDQEQRSEVAAFAHTDGDIPGSSAKYRIMEVGCGVGNTVFPILKTNNDPGLFVYCCDFSSTAVELVKSNPEYDPERCFAFVHDLSDVEANCPVPDGTLDVIVLIFVFSALHPDKMQASISRLARLLKPGGVILLRDYGRYDMAQLRFKKGRCLSENFYVRGDGTRVYFFTQDELHEMFTQAGLDKVQNLVDRRLQVNRGKQITMYRVWIQCKYRKAVAEPLETQG